VEGKKMCVKEGEEAAEEDAEKGGGGEDRERERGRDHRAHTPTHLTDVCPAKSTHLT